MCRIMFITNFSFTHPPKIRCILPFVAILNSLRKESPLKNKCGINLFRITILDCAISSNIYRSKIWHELWAFMQIHPSLHILRKKKEKKKNNKIIVYRVTTIISPNLDQILSYLAHTLFSVCTPRKMFRCHTKRKSWFLVNLIQRHSAKCPSFSYYNVAVFRAYVLHQTSTDIPKPLYINTGCHWQLKE